MNVDSEIQQLRWYLQSAGYEPDEINSICNDVSIEISNGITEAVVSALQEAESIGLEMKADDFLSEISAVQTNDTFQIVTDSGRLDYSEPPFPMLPHLLQKGKQAKDGSIYRRIPIRDKSAQISNSSYHAAEERQAQLQESRKQILDDINRSAASPDVTKSASSYIDAFKQTRPPSNSNKHERSTSVGPVTIRTASSKQNPSSSWVLPAKEADMSNVIAEINDRLRNSILEVIRQTLMKYGG